MEATTPLKLWDARQYLEAYRSGNNSLAAVLKAMVYVGYYYGTLARSPRLGRVSRWLYDRFQSVRGGTPFPRKPGTIAAGQSHPRLDLDLQPGELVRVKSYDEILKTVDRSALNRGLSFDAELVPYCGKVFRVRTRIESFIDEKTGQMRRMKTPAVILDGAYCQSLYSGQRILCPRAVFLWWREIWLERVSDSAAEQAGQEFRGDCHPKTPAMPAAGDRRMSPDVAHDNGRIAEMRTHDALKEREVRGCDAWGGRAEDVGPLHRTRALSSRRARMHAAIKTCSGLGANELFDLLETRATDVESVIQSAKGFGSDSCSPTRDGRA
jgi:hypothetical protein